jgi:N-acetylglutamate synthase-like GNAT family acetyltransferase
MYDRLSRFAGPPWEWYNRAAYSTIHKRRADQKDQYERVLVMHKSWLRMAMRDVFLRLVRLSDAEALQRHCFPDQSLADVQGYLQWCLAQMEKGRMVRLVAEADAQVIGGGQLTVHRHDAEIGSLVVASLWRRRGIGTALLKALIDAAQAHGVQTLELMADTDRQWLQHWYARLGFAPHGEKVLPGDERVIIMRMLLKSPSPGR